MRKKVVFGIILAVVALIAAGGIGAYFFLNNGVDVEAGASLPGIENLINANSSNAPMTILEVVADKSDARVGWLVGGEEPLVDGKSFRDMPSEAERNAAMALYPTGSIGNFGGAYSFDTDYNSAGSETSYEVRGSFVDAAGGDYTYTGGTSTYRDYDPATDDGMTRYKEYIDFSNGLSVGLTFGPFTGLSDLNITYQGNTYTQYYRYDITSVALNTLDADTMNTFVAGGVRLYTRYVHGGLYDYSYIGSLGSYDLDSDGTADVAFFDTMGNPSDATGVISNPNVVAIDIEPTDVGGSYVVAAITPGLTNGCATVVFDYEEDPAGTKVLESTTPSLTYTPGTGDKKFVSNPGGQLYDVASYSGGIKNNDYFKRYVLDIDSPSTFTLDVKVVTIEEFAAINLASVDMVVLRAGNYSTDMGKVAAQSFLKEVVDKKLPVLIETDFDSNEALTYNHRIAVLLQNNINTVSNLDLDTGFDWAAKTASKLSVSAVQVNGNVLIKNGGGYFGPDFLTDFDSSQYTNVGSPLYPVYSEITSENFYRNNAGKPGISNTRINKATAIRYILNFSNQRIVVKSKITVLEIEPCFSFSGYNIGTGGNNDLLKVYDPATRRTVTITNTNSFRHVLSPSYIASNWATQFQGNESNITLVQSYSKEFVGRVEDLNENYDLIYIGTDTSTMNTTISGTVKSPTDTRYNDDNMRGLIYSHVGDTVADNSGTRLTIFGLELYNSRKLYWDNKFDNIEENRLSGNDITESKYVELKEYIDAGYPVVFADNFFNISGGVVTGINTVAIDEHSNMYKLAEYALGRIGRNIFYESEINGNAEVQKRLSDYLNISKLSVEVLESPQPYDYNSGNPRTLPIVNGHYNLKYVFSLKNDAAIGLTTTKYDVELFIDTSVDGRYSEAEKIPSLTVRVLEGGSWVRVNHNAAGKYELIAGKTYEVTRVVPNGYVGILPWKLLFTQNDNPKIRKSVTGYTAIPVAPGDRTPIKVLQLTSAQGENNLDLTNPNVQALFNEVVDFDIQVTKMTSSAFVRSQSSHSVADYAKELNKYDMVIVGFADMYQFGGDGISQTYSNHAAEALQSYINSGKSVLLTHDTTSFFNRDENIIDIIADVVAGFFNDPTFKRYWGFEFNTYIRNVVGMDRYGASDSSGIHDYYAVKKTESKGRTQGYSDFIINRFNDSTSIYRASSRPVYSSTTETIRGGTQSGNYKVSSVNDGQIRHYPFEIPDTFEVANTHGQYYQLNLDTNPRDSVVDDDIVVWYTLSDIVGADDDVYQANPKDVRNNYYIYNRGNVTYSGVGHSAVNTDPNHDMTELKLFINTIVASYSAGVHPPTVSYLSGETGALTIENTYIPFDNVANNVISNEDIKMYFEITDTTFVQGTRALEVKYYVEDASGTKEISYEGEDHIKVRELVPGTSSMKLKKGASVVSAANANKPELDTRYTLEIPVTTLSGINKNVIRVFISAETTYTLANGDRLSSGIGYYCMKIVRTDLFELD